MANVTLIEGATSVDVAAWLHAKLDLALNRTDAPIAVTVPGGTTPFPILERLAHFPLTWSRMTIWPNDDRLVPEDHPASNTGRIRRLLEPCGAEVVSLSEMEAVPHFSLAWLGMGVDGHVASLFPNTDPRADDPLAVRRLMPDPLPPEAPFARITFTLPALLDSDELVFVIHGEDKRAVFEAARRGESDTPVARVLAAAPQPITCFS